MTLSLIDDTVTTEIYTLSLHDALPILRQSGEKQRHARHVAVVFPRLVDASVDHVVERGPVDRCVALHERLDRKGCEVVGADRRERATVAPEGRANGVADENFGHASESIRRGRSRESPPHELRALRPGLETGSPRPAPPAPPSAADRHRACRRGSAACR